MIIMIETSTILNSTQSLNMRLVGSLELKKLELFRWSLITY